MLQNLLWYIWNWILLGCYPIFFYVRSILEPYETLEQTIASEILKIAKVPKSNEE